MGFPLTCYYVAVPEPLILLLKFLDHIRFAISLILFYLGLYPSSLPPTRYRDPEFHPTPASDAPWPVTSISIKAQLPTVEFASFMERSGGRWEHGREFVCVVCLENLAAGDEVRELGNCRHAFHKGCIDRWVDVGQVTCPLCRAQLLPCKGREDGGWLLNFWARIW
uniref:E3 ubiquitin-protein ligase RHA1B n=1 Tax=Elaeis guineensis var. tenera TaxID=51953 RepID=A0A6I9RX75_ELAGV|nr:E3 ubiquitin-protein ligase RHA1B [Elaeis guineensis]